MFCFSVLPWTVPTYVRHRTRSLGYSWASCIVYAVFLTWQLDLFLFLILLVSPATPSDGQVRITKRGPTTVQSNVQVQRRIISSLILPDEIVPQHYRRISCGQDARWCTEWCGPSRAIEETASEYAVAERME